VSRVGGTPRAQYHDLQIQQISRTIALIAKAADAVESLVKTAAAM